MNETLIFFKIVSFNIIYSSLFSVGRGTFECPRIWYLQHLQIFLLRWIVILAKTKLYACRPSEYGSCCTCSIPCFAKNCCSKCIEGGFTFFQMKLTRLDFFLSKRTDPNVFAQVVKVTNCSRQCNTELAWYPPSASNQICLLAWRTASESMV